MNKQEKERGDGMTNIVFKGFNINKVLYEIINERDFDGNEKTILLTKQ